jgi:transcriptional regulator with XRE-family HTH domain
VGWSTLLRRARVNADLSQGELARRARTSRPTLSAYEHGRKAPSADTLERLLAATGCELDVVPLVRWGTYPLGRGRTGWVPDRLWRVPVDAALADVVLPLELDWSAPGRAFVLRDRRERARLYELVLREGDPSDLRRYVDGALLVDAWPDLVLPQRVRAAWGPVIAATPTPSRRQQGRGHEAAS